MFVLPFKQLGFASLGAFHFDALDSLKKELLMDFLLENPFPLIELQQVSLEGA